MMSRYRSKLKSLRELKLTRSLILTTSKIQKYVALLHRNRGLNNIQKNLEFHGNLISDAAY